MKKNILFALCLFFHKITFCISPTDSVFITVEPLKGQFNSKFQEYYPVISADGSHMYFVSCKPIDNEDRKRKEKENKETIYSAEYDSDLQVWSSPVVMSAPLNKAGNNNVVLGITNDGQQVLLYREGINGKGDIWESKLKGADWTEPSPLPQTINSKSHESSASLSPDGNTLYFVSERRAGFGGRDIWISKKNESGVWGEAINAGSKINTSKDEEGVFIHPDGRTLYFSSKGGKSFGGYDVYKSELVNGEWSDAKNLGAPINTSQDDLFFQMKADGKTAFYSRSVEGKVSNADLYEINYRFFKTKPRGPKLTLLKGRVLDSLTSLPVGNTKIRIYDKSTGQFINEISSNSETGNYLISLPSGKLYDIITLARGYTYSSKCFLVEDSAGFNEKNVDIKLLVLKSGVKVVINNIFFEYDRSNLMAESMVELNSVLNMLKESPNIRIQISGHTDNKGSSQYNKNLSAARAKAVVDYLVSKGIPESKLTYKGFGFDQPIANNDTEEGRQLNRRVEFLVIDN